MGKGFLNEGVPASTCGGGCTYLRGRLHVLASKMSQTVAEIVSPILDKRKGRKDSLHTGLYGPQEISAEPVYDQNARKSQSQREIEKNYYCPLKIPSLT